MQCLGIVTVVFSRPKNLVNGYSHTQVHLNFKLTHSDRFVVKCQHLWSDNVNKGVRSNLPQHQITTSGRGAFLRSRWEIRCLKFFWSFV